MKEAVIFVQVIMLVIVIIGICMIADSYQFALEQYDSNSSESYIESERNAFLNMVSRSRLAEGTILSTVGGLGVLLFSHWLLKIYMKEKELAARD